MERQRLLLIVGCFGTDGVSARDPDPDSYEAFSSFCVVVWGLVVEFAALRNGSQTSVKLFSKHVNNYTSSNRHLLLLTLFLFWAPFLGDSVSNNLCCFV